MNVRPVRRFDELGEDLGRRLRADTQASVFATPDWYDVLDRTCPVGGTQSLLLACDGPGGVTVLPLRVHGRGDVRSLSNFYSCQFDPVTSSPQAATEQADVIARWLAEKPVSTLRLIPIDPDGPFWKAFAVALRRRGYWVDRFFAFGNWHHPCAGVSWSSYLAGRPSRLKNTILRTQRKLRTDPSYRLEVLDPGATTEHMERIVADFESVYLRSWKRPEPYPDFIGTLCRTAHRHGWLRAAVSYLDGMPVAAQIWLVKAGVASIYKLAYDQAYAKRGVGTVVTAALIEHVLDTDHVHEIDFLSGDDEYKAEWMSSRREKFGLLAFRQRSPRGMAQALRHFGGKAVRAAQSRFSLKFSRKADAGSES